MITLITLLTGFISVKIGMNNKCGKLAFVGGFLIILAGAL
jgi:hypothetical protein